MYICVYQCLNTDDDDKDSEAAATACVGGKCKISGYHTAGAIASLAAASGSNERVGEHWGDCEDGVSNKYLKYSLILAKVLPHSIHLPTSVRAYLIEL